MRKSSTFFGTSFLRKGDFWFGLGGAFLLATLTWLSTLYLNDLFNPDHLYYLLDSDQARSALVAKSLFEGNGYKTPLLTNAVVDFYLHADKLNVDGWWENADRFPMTILGIAALFKLLGSSHYFIGMVVFGSVFFFASIFLVYRTAILLTQRPVVAVVAVALLCISHDMTDPIFYKGADDIFYSLVVMYAYLHWRDRIQNGNIPRAAVVGAALGVAFLCRQNIGLYTFCAIGLDSALSIFKKQTSFVHAACGLVFMGLAAAAVTLPFALYTLKVWNIPFFTANSLYQFSFHSPYQMGTDAWWKLHTPVGSISNLELFKSDPMPFLANWGKFVSMNFVGLLTAYLLEIAAFTYAVVQRKKDKNYPVWVGASILLVTLFTLNLFSLGFFVEACYAPVYFIYLLPLLTIGAADGVYKLCTKLVELYRKKRPDLTFAFKQKDIDSKKLILRAVLLVLALGVLGKLLPFLSVILGIRGTGLGLIAFKIILGFALFIVIAVTGFLYLPARTESRLVSCKEFIPCFAWAAIACVVFTLQTPALGIKMNNYTVMPLKTQSLEKLKAITTPKSIVLSLNAFYSLPWLIDRKAMGLPEYPDYIYEMIVRDKLPIDAVFLDGAMSWFYETPWRWAPSYIIYPILGKTHGVLPGFELVESRYASADYPFYGFSTLARDIAVYKRIPGFDFHKLLEPPAFYSAGNANDRYHFVSGFGEVGTFGGETVIFASNEVRARYADRPSRLTPWADVDITFQATKDKKPKALVLDAYILGKTQISSYLNLDLDIYDRPDHRDAKKVGDFFIDKKGWVKLKITLPEGSVKDGMNKIGFRSAIFNSVPVCNTSTNLETQVIVARMTQDTCLHLTGNALPSGVLVQMTPQAYSKTILRQGLPQSEAVKGRDLLRSDLNDEMQNTVTEAAGVMLVKRIDFEY